MNSKRVEKSDALTIILHWGIVVTLVFSLLTGLRIAADDPGSVWAKALDGLLLQGDVINWHVWSAWAASFIAVAYVVFLRSARLGSRVVLDAVRRAGLSSTDRQARWSAVNVVLYWVAFGLIAVAAVTGAFLYWGSGVLPRGVVSTVHELVAWGFIAMWCCMWRPNWSRVVCVGY